MAEATHHRLTNSSRSWPVLHRWAVFFLSEGGMEIRATLLPGEKRTRQLVKVYGDHLVKHNTVVAGLE